MRIMRKNKLFFCSKDQKRINTLENEVETLRNVIKDEAYKKIMAKLGESDEIKRLREENKSLRFKNKDLRNENIKLREERNDKRKNKDIKKIRTPREIDGRQVTPRIQTETSTNEVK